jgi:hypothetical protein
MFISTLSLTSLLDWSWWLTSRPGRFTSLHPGKETWYPLYRRLVGPRGRSERVWKIWPLQGFDPRTVQPVASRLTEYAFPAHYSRINTYSVSFRRIQVCNR